MHRRALFVAAGASVLLAACGAQAPPASKAAVAPPPGPPVAAARVAAAAAPADGPRVEIRDFAFAPATLTIPRGGTVSWLNRDAEPHTVVADGGAFRSTALDTGDGYSYRFGAAGSFA